MSLKIQGSGKLNRRIRAGWGAPCNFFLGPLGPHDFHGKISQIIHAGDFPPPENLGGDPVVVREFLLPVFW